MGDEVKVVESMFNGAFVKGVLQVIVGLLVWNFLNGIPLLIAGVGAAGYLAYLKWIKKSS